MEPDLTEEDKQSVYNWIDEIPLSKPKKNISRDFSDGVLLAEVIRYFLPKLVDLHNYSSFNSITQKRNNWETLNKKVLKKLGYQLTKVDVENLVNCLPDMIERVLKNVKLKVECYKSKPEESMASAEKKTVKTVMKVPTMQPSVDADLLTEKEATIQELKETIEIMEVKIKKLEQLIRLKDNKMQALTNMLAQNGIADAPMS